MDEQTTIYIAFGANLGDRQATLALALAQLQQYVTIEVVSHLYETEPAYITNQPRFLNGVLCGSTHLPPEELLDALKLIEHDLGRVAGPRNGPRPVDLDILLYGTQEWHSERLTIPHPRMAERPFVLVPLAEIAPALEIPGVGRVADLARMAGGQGAVIRALEDELRIEN